MPSDTSEPTDSDWVDLVTDEIEDDIVNLPEDPVDHTGRAVCEKPITDLLFNSEVVLPQGDILRSAKVKGRHRNKDCDLTGTYHDNPILNSILHDVEFPDGSVKQHAANVTAENMHAQCDQEGHAVVAFDSILDYSSNNKVVQKKNKHVCTKSGQKRLR